MTEVVATARDAGVAARAALERVVAAGGVAVFPADTLYGLACDPSNAAAIQRIHALKGRDDGKPSAVMFLSPLAMREVLATAGPRTRAALGALLPGPVTAVIHNAAGLYPLACREDRSRLGVRLIAGPLAGADCPLFQTSANRSGEPPPGSFDAVAPEILAGADLAIDAGPVAGAPSTVVDLTRLDGDGSWEVLRQGALAAGEVARLLEAG